MRFLHATFHATCLLVLLCAPVAAQQKNATSSEGKSAESRSATVQATIDHNRVVINVDLRLPDGSMQQVRAWVDNGNPQLQLSRRLATMLGLAVTCDDKKCASPPPVEISIGGMRIPLVEVQLAEIPLRPVKGAAVLAPGMNAEISIPSSILRHYDVLIDFPGHKFSIGMPGTIHFQGVSAKVKVNAENGLIEVPSEIERKKNNLALDVGSSMSFLSEELFDKLATAHSDWSRMIGAVGSANMWGADDEAKWKVMRLDRLEYGPLFLANPIVVSLPKNTLDFYEKRAGTPTAGIVGSNLLVNYRVGIDYAHSTVYFDLGRPYNFPDFDVIGLVLRPEDDGGFTILGVADFDGKPSVTVGPEGVQAGDQLLAVDGIPVRGSSMGQVWSMLGGTPEQERVLTIERAGREIRLVAAVRHFLPEAPDDDKRKKKR